MTMVFSDNAVDQAIESRQSTRDFLPTPVPRETIAHLLELAARAGLTANAVWTSHTLPTSVLKLLPWST